MSTHDARIVAMAAHAGQNDKLGMPYFSHLERVVQRCKYAHDGRMLGVLESSILLEERLQVAYLHDIVEDTRVSLGHLSAMGFSRIVVLGVEAITHFPNEPLADYYWRVSENPLARYVKEHDVADNANPVRLEKLDPHTAARLNKKYADARKFFGWESVEQ